MIIFSAFGGLRLVPNFRSIGKLLRIIFVIVKHYRGNNSRFFRIGYVCKRGTGRGLKTSLAPALFVFCRLENRHNYLLPFILKTRFFTTSYDVSQFSKA